MKKLFTILAVAATLVSCAKEDVVREAAREAIGFDNAFVENSTRSVNDPSFTNTNLFGGFRVYGFVENAPLFKGTEVTGSGLGNTGAWTYEGTQYWVAGANYKFHAVAPITANAQNVDCDVTDGVSFNYTNNGTEDLLYAYQTATGQTTGNNQKVAFTFDHILSKVKFTFLNGYDASNATLKVTNVKITNAHKTANVALNNTTVAWTKDNSDEVVVLDFGAATDRENKSVTTIADYAFGSIYESYNERFVLPSTAEYEYNVTFTVELYINDVQVDVDATKEGVQGYNHTATAKFAPKAGNAYDIKTTITALNIDPSGKQDPIQFTVTEINGWDTDYNDDAKGDNNINM